MALSSTPIVGSAVTVAYCDFSVADGVGDGTSGNPWSLGDAITNQAAWHLLYCRGNGGATTVRTFTGRTAPPRFIVGCNSSWVPIVSPYDANIPTWDGTGAGSTVDAWSYNTSLIVTSGIRIINSGREAIGSTAVGCVFLFCRFSNAGRNGTVNSALSPLYFGCVADGCTSSGFIVDDDGLAILCDAFDNASSPFQLDGDAKAVLCSADSAIRLSGQYAHALLCSIHGGLNAIYSTTVLNVVAVLGCILSGTSGAARRTTSTWSLIEAFVNDYGNASRWEEGDDTTSVALMIGSQDPAFVDPTASPPDYATTATDLVQALGAIFANNRMTIGYYQEASAGEGGAAVRPRGRWHGV